MALKRVPLSVMLWLCSVTLSAEPAMPDKPPAQTQMQSSVDNMLWMTEQYPPFHYAENRKVLGIAVDILEALFKHNNIQFNRHHQILVYPWARGYKELSNNPKAALLTMAFTEERNNLFALSEPLFNERIVLLTRAENNITLNDLNDVSNYVIGVVRDDIGERLLKDKVQKELHLTHVLSSNELLQMLLKGRVDMIAYSQDIVDWQLAQLDNQSQRLKAVNVLAEVPTTIAFNKQVSPDLLQMLNSTIVKMRDDGSIARLLADYRD